MIKFIEMILRALQSMFPTIMEWVMIKLGAYFEKRALNSYIADTKKAAPTTDQAASALLRNNNVLQALGLFSQDGGKGLVLVGYYGGAYLMDIWKTKFSEVIPITREKVALDGVEVQALINYATIREVIYRPGMPIDEIIWSVDPSGPLDIRERKFEMLKRVSDEINKFGRVTLATRNRLKAEKKL